MAPLSGSPHDADQRPIARIAVPAVGWEEHLWIPGQGEGFSRSELRRQTGRYQSAIPAQFSTWQCVLDSAVAADVDEATRALVAFDERVVRRLGTEGAVLGPMSAILLRTESASSSQIEQLTTSARQLSLAELAHRSTPHARLVVGNVRAMEAALQLAGALDVSAILAMHSALLEHQRDMAEHAGRLREVVVWIGPGHAGPLRADFVAPQPHRVEGALADLVAFIGRVDIPPLVQIAIAHAQFETIHPFVDGNGRTGRALVNALLRSYGLVSHVTAPLSGGLLRRTTDYFEALQAFRRGDAGPIVAAFAQAARFAAHRGDLLVDALVTELHNSRSLLVGLRPQATAWRVLPLLVGQPVINNEYVMTALGVGKVTAQRAVDALVDRTVIRECTGQARHRVWQHDGFLGILDAFAAELKRAR